MFPELTDWKKIVEKTKNFVDEYWFENLNLYPSIRYNIFQWLKNHHPDLIKEYQKIYPVRKSCLLKQLSESPTLSNGVYFTQNDYWNKTEKEIKNYGEENKLNFKIYFHHVRSLRQKRI